MVLEIIVITAVVWYYVDKHKKEKKAKLAAANAINNTNPNTSPRPSGKSNADGYYGAQAPRYQDDTRPPPPLYEHGQARVVPEAQLPSYAESEVGGEKRAKVEMNEKGGRLRSV